MAIEQQSARASAAVAPTREFESSFRVIRNRTGRVCSIGNWPIWTAAIECPAYWVGNTWHVIGELSGLEIEIASGVLVLGRYLLGQGEGDAFERVHLDIRVGVGGVVPIVDNPLWCALMGSAQARVWGLR
jgi:hypothetical protein